MLTVITNNENPGTISIPADEMKKLGINDGDEVEFSKEKMAKSFYVPHKAKEQKEFWKRHAKLSSGASKISREDVEEKFAEWLNKVD